MSTGPTTSGRKRFKAGKLDGEPKLPVVDGKFLNARDTMRWLYNQMFQRGNTVTKKRRFLNPFIALLFRNQLLSVSSRQTVNAKFKELEVSFSGRTKHPVKPSLLEMKLDNVKDWNKKGPGQYRTDESLLAFRKKNKGVDDAMFEKRLQEFLNKGKADKMKGNKRDVCTKTVRKYKKIMQLQNFQEVVMTNSLPCSSSPQH
jgi:hypothetical protein